MGIWTRIKKRLKYEWLKRLGTSPTMIYGFTTTSGHYLKDVRISNTAYLGDVDKLELGDNVFIGHYNVLDASNGMFIGEGCQITNFSSIITHSSHHSIRYYGREYKHATDKKGYQVGPVAIGAYTFVGPHCVIMPNTRIGKGCIVGAYSYLEGEYPDYSVIKGQPAKVVGDVRETDQAFLKKHPELQPYYNQWSQNQ